jgi:DNA topoisomerase IB
LSLRRSDPSRPGLSRRRRGRGFTYVGPDGSRITDPETLERLEALKIPPAWQDVWICPWPHGHLQALGTDEAGRRQYLYHEDWRLRRDREKFTRAEELGRCLPELRDRVQDDLGDRGLTEERVLAAAVRLVDLGLFRSGNEQYTRQNGSYGLTTLLREHVTVRGASARFCFAAKHGVEFCVDIRDPEVVDVVRALVRRNDPNPELLGFWSPSARAWRDVKSEHLNAYLRDVVQRESTVKDFRTWHASVLMAVQLSEQEDPGTHAKRQRVIASAYKEVAAVLHNTPAVTRSAYVDPRVVDLWQSGRCVERSGEAGSELVPLTASQSLSELLRAA